MDLPYEFTLLVFAWAIVQSLTMPLCGLVGASMAHGVVPSWGTRAMLTAAAVSLVPGLVGAAGPVLIGMMKVSDYGQLRFVLSGVGVFTDVLFGAGFVKCASTLGRVRSA